MKLIVTKDYEELSARAAEIVISAVRKNPYAVLGLATGTTPLGVYARLAADHERRGTSYAHVRTVNLDEYAGLPASHAQSYAYFMKKHLFDLVDIRPENTYIEDGMAADPQAECARYDALLDRLPRDLQLLGLGSNGHIAFNEPGTPFHSRTRLTALAESTVRDNARLFAREEDVPRRAFTMGIEDIMQAKKIVLLASGAGKAQAVHAVLHGAIDRETPASVLRLHPDCTVILDREAAGQ